MGQVMAGIALLLVAGTGTSAGPVRLLHPDGWPDPIPASSVGPLNWSTIHPPIYASQWSLSSSSLRPSNKDPNAPPLKSSISVTDTSLPNIVDWRNRDGVNYITTPQDQGVCNSCWAFATTALIEAMVRIEHGAWTKRSEADVHSGVGALCADYGSADEALAWMAGMPQPWDQQNRLQNPPGVADWACGPYEDRDPTIRTRCADRDGRATHVPPFQALGTMEDQKRWLDRYGPLVATFVLYSDFGTWRPTEKGTVYQWDGMKDSVGNHLALVVGYDDNKQAWIIKNSWGRQWGEDGFAYIAYGTGNIDNWVKHGVMNVNPDPWTRRRHQNGCMLQSSNGNTHRNFELVLPAPKSKDIYHVYRDGDSGRWTKATKIHNADLVGPLTMIGTSFNRDLYALGLEKGAVLHQWKFNQAQGTWSHTRYHPDIQDIDGVPGLTQTDDSRLVMVVKLSNGTLIELLQEPNSQGWIKIKQPIATNISQSGPSLVQSNVGLNIYDPNGNSRGNIYIVAVRDDGRLQLFWRPGDGDRWQAGEIFGQGVPSNSPPVMIQDFFDTVDETSVGGFQLVVAVSGQVQHWVRDNRNLSQQKPVEGAQGPWRLVESVGNGVLRVWALVQGSFGQKMHMITEGADGRFSYWEWDGRWERLGTLPTLDEEWSHVTIESSAVVV